MRLDIRTIVILLLTIGLLALFLRHADLGQVWVEIRRAQGGLLVAGTAVTGLTYVLRAARWQYMLGALGATRFSTALRATVIGFAATFMLPARAGEFVRPYLLARREGLSATATFATIIVERLLDLVTVLLLLGSYLLLFDPGMAAVDARVFDTVKLGGGLVALAALAAMVVLVALAGHPTALGRATMKVERVLPGRVAGIAARLVRLFAEGLGVVRQPARMMVSLVLSIPLWLSIACGVWLVTRAFHIAMPYTGSFLLLALLTVGVAVPTPGAVGGFHEAFRIGATVFYAVPNDRAVGAAIVLQAIAFVPVTLVGLALMAQDGMTMRRIRALGSADEAAAEESS